jgi:hypothetical protein
MLRTVKCLIAAYHENLPSAAFTLRYAHYELWGCTVVQLLVLVVDCVLEL